MRFAVCLIAGAMLLAACNPSAPDGKAPAGAAEDTSAGSSGVGRIGSGASALLDPISLQGTWSFDRTCASGDGMTLKADGSVSYGEDSEGMWGINEAGALVLILRRHEPGVEDDNLGERQVLVISASEPAADNLVGELSPGVGGDGPSPVNASRCP